jgi:hypothetical protein
LYVLGNPLLYVSDYAGRMVVPRDDLHKVILERGHARDVLAYSAIGSSGCTT